MVLYQSNIVDLRSKDLIILSTKVGLLLIDSDHGLPCLLSVFGSANKLLSRVFIVGLKYNIIHFDIYGGQIIKHCLTDLLLFIWEIILDGRV